MSGWSGFRLSFAAAALALAPGGMALAEPPSQITIGCGNPGTNWCVIGTGMAQIFAREGVNSNTEIGAGISNVIKVSNNQFDTAITMAVSVPMAVKGEAPYPEPIHNVRAIASLLENILQMVVNADSGVETIPDLEGRSFASFPKGNTSPIVVNMALKAYGLTPEDVDFVYGGTSHNISQVQDRRAVGFSMVTAYPASAFTQIASTSPVNVLPISDEAFENILEMNPGFSRAVLPANTYEGQTEDVPSISTPAVYLTQAERDDDQVYWITKTLVEALPEIRRINFSVSKLTAEQMATTPGVELHPGAKRYYREIGVIE